MIGHILAQRARARYQKRLRDQLELMDLAEDMVKRVRRNRPHCVTAWHRLSATEVNRIQHGVMSIGFSLNHNPSLRSTYEKAYEEWGY